MRTAVTSRGSWLAKRIFGIATIYFLFALGSVVEGYEQATHAAMTREAYVRARLNPDVSDVAARLGMQGAAVISLGDLYVDITPSGPVARLASPSDNPNFASDKIIEVNKRSTRFQPPLNSIADWMMLGAIREDDVKLDLGAQENNPQDDPGGAFDRVLNHFYDPYLDRPLWVGKPFGAAAPEWALDKTSNTSRNHFGVPAAREAMWRALTLKKIDSSGVLVDLVSPSDYSFPVTEEQFRERLRTEYWATTFRALGDILHLLQDMAQPQHTRNDPHSGLVCSFGVCPGGHASYYEKYVDARARGRTAFTLRERFFASYFQSEIAEAISPMDLAYGGYPVVSFARYRDYFASTTGGASLNGSGLANYSNQGFFTAGTNIDKVGGGYPSPPPNTNGMQIVTLPPGSVLDASENKVPSSGALTLFKGAVRDNLNPTLSDPAVALSSLGAFDQFMRPLGQIQVTLNHYNYDDQARLLIPRAVAYSAGFLDYFFRGQLEISLPAAGVYAVVDNSSPICVDCGFSKVKLKLKNTTSGETMSNGFFVAVVKFYRNKDYQPDLSGEPGGPNFVEASARSWNEQIVVSSKVDVTVIGGQLAPDAEVEIPFMFPQPIPINATDIFLQVVFRGTLGNEADAVVVGTKDISEPNYITLANNYDYYYQDATDTFTVARADLQTPITQVALKLGSNMPIATVGRLDVHHYAQLAVLTDLSASGTEKLVLEYVAHHPSPMTYDQPVVTFVGSDGGPYVRTREVVKYRGMWSDHRYDFFNGDVYEIAICPPTDVRHICTSAGLTTMSVADGVPWMINY